MIRRDLVEARAAWLNETSDSQERERRERSAFLAYEDAEGRTLDFHATRHSYITLLARAGVHPKMAQDLARHSTINLTMNNYTQLGLYDQAAALEGFPSILPPDTNTPSEAAAMSPTGTDGAGALHAPCTNRRHFWSAAVIGGHRKG
jgi:hypothetical protein